MLSTVRLWYICSIKIITKFMSSRLQISGNFRKMISESSITKKIVISITSLENSILQVQARFVRALAKHFLAV
jgi:hypothetical protein